MHAGITGIQTVSTTRNSAHILLTNTNTAHWSCCSNK